MHDQKNTYFTRKITVGGHSKEKLIALLQQQGILMNVYAEIWLTDSRFTVSSSSYNLDTVEVTVGDLGFTERATTERLFNKAQTLGLHVGPIELGPYTRLHITSEQEGQIGHPATSNQAPYGFLTIASDIHEPDDTFPKGFYIRKINGARWLRGYICDDLHVWRAHDRFLFIKR